MRVERERRVVDDDERYRLLEVAAAASGSDTWMDVSSWPARDSTNKGTKYESPSAYCYCCAVAVVVQRCMHARCCSLSPSLSNALHLAVAVVVHVRNLRLGAFTRGFTKRQPLCVAALLVIDLILFCFRYSFLP
jgi:hypothetical protein